MTMMMFDIMLVAHYGFHAHFPIWLWCVSFIPIGFKTVNSVSRTIWEKE